LDTLDKTQVLVFSGETGCGKSTQLPAFILEDQLSKGKPCKVFVTEPRRISAISLAQRVSVELGEAPGAMGNSSSLVGYSIRLEAKMSPSTRLAFVTNGIALRMLEGGAGSSFDEVTHIVVDEVHERSIESDFLLIVLKQLLEVRKDLKVILMSATVDAEKISEFFGGCPAMQVPGRTFPVQVQYLEDAVELAGWHIDESSPYAVWDRNRKTGAKKLEWSEEAAETAEDAEDDDDKPADPTKLTSSKYSSRTVATVNLLDSRKIPYDLIVRLLERICFEDTTLQPFSAATLVFMPGLAEIRKLHEELQSHPHFGTRDFAIYPLHSSISSEGQSSVFDIPPSGVRKIVICECTSLALLTSSNQHRRNWCDDPRHHLCY
jgi:ATP-dependent RNA helicase DHX29